MRALFRSLGSLGAVALLVHCSSDETSSSDTTGGDVTPASATSGMPGTGGEGGSGGGHVMQPKPANIVFVLADDFTWSLVQYMPHVLQMQEEGATFSNYFVTDSLCCPSRTSIFTGMFPHDTGVFTNGGDDGGYATFEAKGNGQRTFANALSGSGFRTALMGKFLNGYDPAVLPVPDGWAGWAVAGGGYKGFDYDLNQTGTLHHYAHADADYLTDVVSGLGTKFIGDEPGKPFLLEIATFAPHSPYTPAPRDAEAFPGLEAPRTPAYDARPGPTAPSWLKAIPALTHAEKQKMDKSFRMRAQAVLAIDQMIGALQDAVAAAGHADDTYFVFSSDNGYHMGEHSLRPGKQTAFETDIHVPLIITGPGISGGQTLDQIVQNIDLCSTFAEMGQAPPPPTQTGHSLMPLLHGETVTDWRDVALVEHHGEGFDPSDPDLPEPESGNPPTYTAIRTKSSVYVEYVGGEVEFHDHTTDPDELDNTAGVLTAGQKEALSATLGAIRSCHDAATCWTAQHLLPGAP